MAVSSNARFIEPMLLLRTDSLPTDGARWAYELKLDGYRAIAYTRGGAVHLRSRNDHDFNGRYPGVVRGLAHVPDRTILDGELVGFDEEGRPSFDTIQNHSSPHTPIVYFVFDLMMLAGRDVTTQSLESRRALLEQHIVPVLEEPVRYSAAFDAPLRDLIHSVREQGLEGLVAKRRDSRYEPGLRSGAWLKMRVNRAQDFVIGGYTIGTKTFDALVVGYYEGDRLLFAARTRNGFTPLVRDQLFKKLRSLEIAECPFANLPEAKSGRWGEGLTKAKMASCRWVEPRTVARVEFLEWTADNHLRHSRFAGLRDTPARDVTRE
jgi:bifunctional non-homologous end joining protein LigD